MFHQEVPVINMRQHANEGLLFNQPYFKIFVQLSRTIAFLAVFFLLAGNTKLFSQKITCQLRISILTCTPGKELYTSFGHSAIRMIDTANQTDNVYNFGTFKPNEPNFYRSYVTGDIKYYFSVGYTDMFVNYYKSQRQGIIEQVLNLTCDEQLLIYKELLTMSNSEKNKFYVYNFQYDNCTTRIRDLLFKTSKNLNIRSTPQSGKASFRSIVHEYLNKQERDWEKTGIDILLGSRTDNKLTDKDLMFNPQSFSQFMDSVYTSNQQSLVFKKEVIIPASKIRINKPLISPLTGSVMFLLMAISVTILRHKKRESFSGMLFDRLLLLGSGITGLVILFLWFFSSNYYYSMNYNLLWANPLSLTIGFSPFHKPQVKKYTKIIFISIIIYLTLVLLGVQKTNVPIIFVALSLLLRNYFLSSNGNNK